MSPNRSCIFSILLKISYSHRSIQADASTCRDRMDGFQFLEQLDEVNSVIFVTAYDQYAIKAFEINALDYLLKPLNPIRLKEAVNRFLSRESDVESTEERLSPEKKIFIKDGDSCHFVPVYKIFLLESVGNYVRVHYENQKPLLHKSLSFPDLISCNLAILLILVIPFLI